MNTHIPVSLLADYIEGFLPTEQAQTIKQHLDQCTLCRATAVGLHESSQLGEQHDVLLATIADKKAEFQKNNPQLFYDEKILPPTIKIGAAQTSPKLHWWRYAASIAAVLLLAIGFWWINSSPNSMELADLALQQAHIQQIETYTKGEESAAVAEWEKALYLEKYEQAVVLLKPIADTSSLGNREQLALGKCYLYQTKPDYQSAIIYLQAAAQNDILYDQATWLSALAYTKSGQTEKAKELLQALQANGNGYKRKDIERLLKTL